MAICHHSLAPTDTPMTNGRTPKQTISLSESSYAETLFLIRTILLRSCNDTVEHVAEAGEHKAYDSGDYLALNGKAHADNG